MIQFIIIGLTLILLLCVGIYFFIHHQMKNKFEVTLTSLENSKESERNLRVEIRELQNKMYYAMTDAVTHLAGWQLFEDRLNQAIQESARYQLTLGVLFVDIDDFKVINNALGYMSSDELLQEVAGRLKSSIRQVDTVSRFSKDIFVILLTQLAKPETAALVAQRVLQSLAEPFRINGNDLHITACIGIGIYPV
ncbi:MAG: GGDEF domain-containing protein, partial [Gammaproteobacteria bacterium]